MKHIPFYTAMILLPTMGLVSKNNAQVQGNKPYELSCFRITEATINSHYTVPKGFPDTPGIRIIGKGSANLHLNPIDTKPRIRYFLVGVNGSYPKGGLYSGMMDAVCACFPEYDSLVRLAERRLSFIKIKSIHIVSISEVTKEENEAFWGRKN